MPIEENIHLLAKQKPRDKMSLCLVVINSTIWLIRPHREARDCDPDKVKHIFFDFAVFVLKDAQGRKRTHQ